MICFYTNPEKLKIILNKGKKLQEILNARNISIQIFKLSENETCDAKWDTKQCDFYGEYKIIINPNISDNNYPKNLITLNYGFNRIVEFEPFEIKKPQIFQVMDAAIIQDDIEKIKQYELDEVILTQGERLLKYANELENKKIKAILNYDELDTDMKSLVDLHSIILKNIATELELTVNELLYFLALQLLKEQLNKPNEFRNIRKQVANIKKTFNL